MARVLVIGDLHCPADLDQYRKHVCKVRSKWKTNRTVFIGDIVDGHRWGRWDPTHDAPDSESEYKQTLQRVKWWHQNFKDSTVVIGNHDERSVRQARSAGIPDGLIKNYNDAWKTPTWKWVDTVDIDSVRYFHGEGFSGKYPHVNAALAHNQSICMGHIHSVAAIQWVQRPNNFRFFGMCVGSGIDQDHPALRYASRSPSKSIISCGVVIDGTPYLEVM